MKQNLKKRMRRMSGNQSKIRKKRELRQKIQKCSHLIQIKKEALLVTKKGVTEKGKRRLQNQTQVIQKKLTANLIWSSKDTRTKCYLT